MKEDTDGMEWSGAQCNHKISFIQNAHYSVSFACSFALEWLVWKSHIDYRINLSIQDIICLTLCDFGVVFLGLAYRAVVSCHTDP